MENQQIFLESKKGKKNRPIKISNFTIIGATTDPQKLLQPLRDRFKMSLDFEHYDNNELEIMLKNRCRQIDWVVEDNVLTEIARRGKGTPRIALRLLESVKMTASSVNSENITMEHFNITCQLEGIDDIGLCGNEIKYLKILQDNNGSARLNVLSSIMSLHPKHISHIIENYLVRIGLVTKSNSLRVLTQPGLEHIRSNYN